MKSETLWSHVNKTETCWLWTGRPRRCGYGYVWYEGRTWRVHRLVYTLLVGPIPYGLVLDHVKARGCTSTLCVNPAHLEPVTIKVNTMRGDSFAVVHAAATHCPAGHALVAGNLRPADLRRGFRGCLTCHRRRNRESARARYARGKAASDA